MEFDLHPEAVSALEREAATIFELASQIYASQATPADNFLIVNGLSIPIDIMWQNQAVIGSTSSDATAVAFRVSDKMVQIRDTDFIVFSRFAERVQVLPDFRDMVSVAAARTVLARWIQSNLENASTLSPGFMHFFTEWVRENVREQTVIFPIYEVIFDGELHVSGVTVRNLSVQELRSWYVRRAEIEGHPEVLDAGFDEWRRKIADRAAAFVKLLAEPIRAEEIAYAKVDRVLSILRSYSPAMRTAEGRSFCTVYGMEHLESRTVISLQPDGGIRLSQTELGGGPRWHLTEEYLRDLVRMYFVQTCALLELESPTDFQTRVMNAIDLYSRAALEHRIESKLLFILSAIEHLLLMGTNEPVAANLARRFAYFVGGALEERRAIQRRLRDVYDLRSKFVHHGRGIDNLLLIEEFLRDAWRFFRGAAEVANEYKDKASFLQAMDDEMLSGPMTQSPPTDSSRGD
jgi:hypothetical protein